MSADAQARWLRIEALVDAALDLPPDERLTYLETEAAGDAALLAEARKILSAGEADATWLDQPVAHLAVPLLSGDPGAGSHGPEPSARRIGPYRILAELGTGGMGAVLLAERDDGEFRQTVALKLIRRGLQNDPRLLRRFRDERQILASLQHPDIARLLDGGLTADGLPYFAMEYVEGQPIDRYCDDRRLHVEARLALFARVCDALAYAHRRAIVHRDIKPSNVLVTSEGTPKLLDFGIAKLLAADSAAESSSALTRTGERLLTPEYACPEQIRGEAVTPAADVFALGILLYELLTGQRPYRRGGTSYEIERAILEEEPTRPSTAAARAGNETSSAATALDRVALRRAGSTERLRRRLRGDLDAIVLRALDKQPTRRYRDAGELAADIRRHLDGQPISVRAGERFYRVQRAVRRHRPLATGVGAGLVFALAAVAVAFWPRPEPPGSGASGAPVLAIGRINDYRPASESRLDLLTDMLATNLARAEGLQVVSAARMFELLREVGRVDDPSADAFVRAARLAGATQLLDGALYATADGELRLDLRRIELATGAVLGAETATGADLFALADSGTRRLVAQLGVSPPTGSIADVTTRSLTAYRLYAEGLRHFYQGDPATAQAHFDDALREDSMFAMAAFYSARSLGYNWRSPGSTFADQGPFQERISRALRLSDGLSDRERLTIRAWWARHHLVPEMRAVAETLAIRYPQELEGHLALGVSMTFHGNFLQSIPHFERVVAMDSTTLSSAETGCPACDALRNMVNAYMLADSLAAAERAARYWLSLQPASRAAHYHLAEMLDQQGRHSEAADVLQRVSRGATGAVDPIPHVEHRLRSGEPARADSLLLARLAAAGEPDQPRLLIYYTVSLRNQGRLREALETARRLRSTSREPVAPGSAPFAALAEAQTLFDLGRYREAAALFDSIARSPATDLPPSVQGTRRVWVLGQLAAALAAAGDTTRLAMLADSIENEGSRVFITRARDQHHYVRGLLLAARGRDADAVAEFQAALAHTTVDFGRINYDLAGVLLRQGRPLDAVMTLNSARRGAYLTTTNLHITLTEIEERTAEAWMAAGRPDSAAVRWHRVARAWINADPLLAARARRARELSAGHGPALSSGVAATARQF